MQKLSLVALFQTLYAFQNPNAFTLKHKYWWKFVLQSFIFNNQKFLVLIALMSYRLFHIFITILYTLILNINLKTFPSDYYKRKKVGRKKFLFVKLFINTITKKIIIANQCKIPFKYSLTWLNNFSFIIFTN